MRQQLIITICLGTVLVIAIALKLLFFQEIRGHSAYYFLSTFWICGLLVTIFTLNMIWTLFSTKKGAQQHRPSAFWPNRRKTFRIIYPVFIRPMVIIDKIDDTDRRQLEFPVVDLSQEGCCFVDDGCLGLMKTFSGHIRFHNGDTISTSGEFIRKTGSNVSVRFTHTINWATLLKEQRRVMTHMKSTTKPLP